ncbi:MAG: hypothetical protein NXY59_09600 [Aigarchaeota archaeon]|nr:hypothetical protein [Candidatus Pelearchaeum maunauluense]
MGILFSANIPATQARNPTVSNGITASNVRTRQPRLASITLPSSYLDCSTTTVISLLSTMLASAYGCGFLDFITANLSRQTYALASPR